MPLEPRERFGVCVAIGGLALLGISLAGGSDHGDAGPWIAVALWLGVSAAAARGDLLDAGHVPTRAG